MTKGVGIHNESPTVPVALTQWNDDGYAVEECLELCDALANFDPHMTVLIKPNLVEYIPTFPFPPYGICTTSVVVDRVIRYLKDAGAKDIVIAESGLTYRDLGCDTKTTFDRFGYDYFTKQYGVKLLDLAEEPFEKVKLDGFSLSVAKAVLDADFMINIPALKTHEQTKVSLGFKNNKGCLSSKSKQVCHSPNRSIEEFVVRLGEKLYPHLTLIDGTYSLECGPMHLGKAYRENLIIASTDMFACDCVGSYLMGMDPSDILCLKMFAEGHNRSCNLKDIEVKGLNPTYHVRKIKYIDDRDSWHSGNDVPDFFTRSGVRGFRLPHPGQTLCTGCSLALPMSVLLIIAGSMANGGKPYDDYELLCGKSVEPSGHSRKTFLMGDCVIARQRKESRGIQEAIPIPGCPVSLKSLLNTYNEHGISCSMDSIREYFEERTRRYAENKDLFTLKDYFLK